MIGHRQTTSGYVRPAIFPVTQTAEPPAWLVQNETYPIRQAFAPPEPPPPEPLPEPPTQVPQAPDPDVLREQQLAQAIAQAETEGRARGEAAGRAVFEDNQKRLDAILTELAGARDQYRAAMEQQLIELSLCIAQSILNRELRGDPQYVVSLAKEALALIDSEEEVQITVGPTDQELLAGQLSALTAEHPRIDRLTLQTDERIKAGCLIETRLARVDATVEGRIRNVAQSLISQTSEPVEHPLESSDE